MFTGSTQPQYTGKRFHPCCEVDCWQPAAHGMSCVHQSIAAGTLCQQVLLVLLSWCSFQALLDDASFALELAELESDSSGAASAAADSELASLLSQARASLQGLSTGLDKWELRMLLSGPYDEAGALLTITAGAGE